VLAGDRKHQAARPALACATLGGSSPTVSQSARCFLCQQELNITIYSDRLQPPNLPLITSMVQAGPFTAVQYSNCATLVLSTQQCQQGVMNRAGSATRSRYVCVGWPAAAGQLCLPRTSRPEGSGRGSSAPGDRRHPQPFAAAGPAPAVQLGPPGPGGLLGRAFSGQHMHVTARGRHAHAPSPPGPVRPSHRLLQSMSISAYCFTDRWPYRVAPVLHLIYGGLFFFPAPLLVVMIVYCRLTLTTGAGLELL
jgi:hypothetical protein